MQRLITALVRAWTRLYTAHMEPALRDRRRSELESHLWELTDDDQASDTPPAVTAFHMVASLILGAPHDVWWRFEHQRHPQSRFGRLLWFAVTFTAAVIAGLWVLTTVQQTVIPVLPPSPIERYALPPPPPPPPPRPPPKQAPPSQR
jgi:hypothetical protein